MKKTEVLHFPVFTIGNFYLIMISGANIDNFKLYLIQIGILILFTDQLFEWIIRVTKLAFYFIFRILCTL